MVVRALFSSMRRRPHSIGSTNPQTLRAPERQLPWFSHHNPSITFTHQNVPTNLPPDLALCVYRIVQEGLQNALKHSQANTISVRLSGNSHGLAVTVVDDGVGFVAEGVGHQGFGLISMGERIEAMGGSFNVWSSPHRGTRLNVTMPLPATENSGTLAV